MILDPVYGEWSSWSEFSSCELSKLNETWFKTRTRICQMKAGDLECQGPSEETIECNFGEWSSWSEYSSCEFSKLEKIWSKTKTRQCEKKLGDMDCQGPSEENIKCNFGEWSSWSEYSNCEKTNPLNDRWYESRSRTCIKNGSSDLDCEGQSEETTECNPIDGGWSDFGLWMPCSKSCGQGTKRRFRFCNDPMPTYGGLPCSGNNYEDDSCFTNCSKGKCLSYSNRNCKN